MPITDDSLEADENGHGNYKVRCGTASQSKLRKGKSETCDDKNSLILVKKRIIY